MRPFVIGTRKSALALAQTRLVEEALRAAFSEIQVEIKEISTIGDQRLDLSLSDAAGQLDKGLFTKELEEALLDRRIDAAVHSLKDLPTVLPQGLALRAVLPRADVSDWLISKMPGGISALREGATVATSSLRRKMQLQSKRPDLKTVEVRGNVVTRLNKLIANSDWSSTVLAAAGLDRLGLANDGEINLGNARLYVTNLTPEIMLPAVGQGAIGIEVRSEISDHDFLLEAINHVPTWEAVTLERELLSALGGGCQMPLGVRSHFSGGRWALDSVLHRDGKEFRASGHNVADIVAKLLS